MKTNLSYLLSLCFFLFIGRDSNACSSFSFISPSDRVIVGKNYDWFAGHGHGGIYVYPRGIQRVSFPSAGGVISNLLWDYQPEDPFTWISQYGSVTFTQFGKGMHVSGINEKGLAIEVLQLNETQYPEKNAEVPQVNESQWAEFQLDHFETTQQVIDHVSDLGISRTLIGLHYLITDASGNSAVVEFLDGEAKVYSGDELPVTAVTNTPYSQVLKDYQGRTGFLSGLFNLLKVRTSGYRFNTLAEGLKRENIDSSIQHYETETQTHDHLLPEIEAAFHLLDAVKLNGSAPDAPFEPTQWSIVYNVTDKIIHLRTRSNPSLRTIDMDKIDFESLKEVLVLDMDQDDDQPLEGEISGYLKPYTKTFNKYLVNKNTWVMPSATRVLKKRLYRLAKQEGSEAVVDSEERD
jgi:choloylglycine hydrolase